MTLRTSLRRWHIWLGWLVGVPLLLWTLSGLVMVARPMEVVRGEGLLKPVPPVVLEALPVVPGPVAGLPLKRLSLEQRSSGPQWVIELAGAPARRADYRTGKLLLPLSALEAEREVMGRYTGQARVEAVSRTDSANPPLELRRPIEAWQVRMNDGTHFYVDAATGAVLATRTGWWRVYDWMWGLHIMDLSGREDTHHPFLIGFAAVSLLTLLLALALLPLSRRRRRP